MGIKHFFYWAKKQFNNSIYTIKHGEILADITEEGIMNEPVSIDNFMIDMNGIFHNSAQRVYEYGNYKPAERLLGKRAPVRPTLQKQQEFFKDICETVNNLVNIVQPNKRVVMCVDGPAPIAKQIQQKKRRFVSATSRSENDRSFDSNSITPGTKMMDYLSKYIDWYIKKQMSDDNSIWKKLEVIFSNEKSAGEGEHKLLSFIRSHNRPNESYCIQGMDADLIMLSLGTQLPNFYILREEPPSAYSNPNIAFYLININGIRQSLIEKMRWDDNKIDRDFIANYAINDFILMCFTVGNDFLPHIPAVEIIENGIEMMLDVYRTVCEQYGHLTRVRNGKIKFCREALSMFLNQLATYEAGVLANKLEHKGELFPDTILEKNSTLIGGKYNVNMEKYREEYYATNFEGENINLKTLCHEYLDGMQWVITYYTHGVPDWNWRYKYHYAPFAHTLAQYVKSYHFKEFSLGVPTLPYIQLLSVLPPKSAHLLPNPLNKLLSSTNSPLADYCPDEFKIDLSGKRREWEGIALLPILDYKIVEDIYLDHIQKVEAKERKRNILGKSFVYSRVDKTCLFKSYYGDIQCKVFTKPIDL